MRFRHRLDWTLRLAMGNLAFRLFAELLALVLCVSLGCLYPRRGEAWHFIRFAYGVLFAGILFLRDYRHLVRLLDTDGSSGDLRRDR